MPLSDDSRDLFLRLQKLARELDAETKTKYGRINPFYENLFDWNEHGMSWTKQDRHITIYNSTTIVGNVDIGDHTWIGPFCSLDGTGGLKIGRFCSISVGCQLLTHDTVKWAVSGGHVQPERARVEIGDCCYLGTHSIIVKGVSVGDHCIIGAGAIVTKNVPAYSIVAGVPARKIGDVEIQSNGEVRLLYPHRSS